MNRGLFLILFLFSCQSTEKRKAIIEDFSWLLGDWERTNEKEDRNTYESWKKVDETQYVGLGFTIQQKDTMNKSEIIIFLKSLHSYLESNTLNEIAEFCDYLKLSKGTELIQEGKRHHFFYFITKGSVKSYYLKEGKEICTWFAFEKEMVSTIKTFEGLTSNETIKLLEDTEFIRINTKAFKNLTGTEISVSRLINELITGHAIFLEELLYLQSKPGKERYENLIKAEPQLLQRVSLTDLASFLGLSRETLSRIRSNT